MALPYGRGNPLNGNILVRGGKETNWDLLTSSERKGESPNRILQRRAGEDVVYGTRLSLVDEVEMFWKALP